MLSRRFTRRQIDIAIEVLAKSQFVQKWCEGEARAYGIAKDSPEYAKFVAENSRKYARRLLR